MNIINIGARKEGKTTLALYLLQQRHRGIVVFDPRGMIEGQVVWDSEQLVEAMDEQREREQDPNERRKVAAPIVYRFDTTDHDQAFSDFCAVVFPPNFPIGGFGVLIDESNLLQGANSIHPDLSRVIKMHPSPPQCPPDEGITIVQTTHTLGETWAKGRSLIDELNMFRLTAPSDTKAIVEYTGRPELVEVIEGLPQHHYVRYINSRQPEGQPDYYVMDDPEIWDVKAIAVEREKKPLDNNLEWESTSSVKVL